MVSPGRAVDSNQVDSEETDEALGETIGSATPVGAGADESASSGSAPCRVTSLALNLTALVAVVAPVWSDHGDGQQDDGRMRRARIPSMRMATRPKA